MYVCAKLLTVFGKPTVTVNDDCYRFNVMFRTTHLFLLFFQIHKNEITAPVFDPFYTPILGKVDQVFAGLSFNDEPCRERLICSMYKNPLKFSPHSNLISNELSRYVLYYIDQEYKRFLFVYIFFRYVLLT